MFFLPPIVFGKNKKWSLAPQYRYKIVAAPMGKFFHGKFESLHLHGLFLQRRWRRLKRSLEGQWQAWGSMSLLRLTLPLSKLKVYVGCQGYEIIKGVWKTQPTCLSIIRPARPSMKVAFSALLFYTNLEARVQNCMTYWPTMEYLWWRRRREEAANEACPGSSETLCNVERKSCRLDIMRSPLSQSEVAHQSLTGQ